MTRPLKPQYDLMQYAAQSRDPARIRRALVIAEDKVAMFTALVPWPALAASFQRDVDLLKGALVLEGTVAGEHLLRQVGDVIYQDLKCKMLQEPGA